MKYLVSLNVLSIMIKNLSNFHTEQKGSVAHMAGILSLADEISSTCNHSIADIFVSARLYMPDVVSSVPLHTSYKLAQ